MSKEIVSTKEMDRAYYCRLKDENERLHQLMKEKDEQVEALLYAIDLLSKLSCSSESNIGEGDKYRISKALNELNSKWNFDETAIPIILSEIHKLQSAINVVSTEADLSESENKSLRESLKKYEDCNLTLSNTVKKLYNRNLKLKKNLKKAYKENKKLATFLKYCTIKARMECEENEMKNLELQTALHEKSLHYHQQQQPDDEISFASSLTSTGTIFEDGMATVCLRTKSLIHTIEISAQNDKLGLQFLFLEKSGYFIVCGFHGFNDLINMRPDLGSKLILIDDENLEEAPNKYNSISELHNMMTSKLHAKKNFTLSFRKDELTKNERETLSKAIIATNDSYTKNKSSGIFKVPISNNTVSDSEEREEVLIDNSLKTFPNRNKTGDKPDKQIVQEKPNKKDNLVLREWSVDSSSYTINNDKQTDTSKDDSKKKKNSLNKRFSSARKKMWVF